MLPQNGAKWILDLFDLGDCETILLPFVRLQADRANGDLLLCDTVADRSLGDVFSTTLDVGYDRRVWASGGCRIETGWSAHSRQCAKAPCVEATDVEIAWQLAHLFARVERVRVVEGLALAWNFRCAGATWSVSPLQGGS